MCVYTSVLLVGDLNRLPEEEVLVSVPCSISFPCTSCLCRVSKAVEVNLICNWNLLNRIHPRLGPGCKLILTSPDNCCGCFQLYFSQHASSLLASFVSPFMKDFAKEMYINTDLGVPKTPYVIEGMCLRLQKLVFKSTYAPLSFGSALTSFLWLSHALLASCFFSTLIIFAHADWMKIWGKHLKQLSKTWFPFSSWQWCWFAFQEWIGRTCMPGVLFLHPDNSAAL